MGRFKKIILVFLIAILTLSIMVGCGAQKNLQSVEDTTTVSSNSEASYESENASFGNGNDSPLEPEKVITTIDLQFETTEFDNSNNELDKIIRKHQAYVEYSNISYSSKSYRNGDYVIRVPKNNIQNFKTDLNNIGNKTWESVNKDDVTRQYTDTESRLRVIEVKEERILALMEKAEKIEDIIALEKQLGDIIYEKEKLQSSLIDLDDKVDFSTINLYIREVDKISSSTTPDTSFVTKVLDAIGDSLHAFKNTLERFIISLIYLLPFIIIFGGIGFLAYKGVIKYRKNKKE